VSITLFTNAPNVFQIPLSQFQSASDRYVDVAEAFESLESCITGRTNICTLHNSCAQDVFCVCRSDSEVGDRVFTLFPHFRAVTRSSRNTRSLLNCKSLNYRRFDDLPMFSSIKLKLNKIELQTAMMMHSHRQPTPH